MSKCCEESPKKMPKEKPELKIYSDDLPQLKEFKIDGVYELRLKVKIKNMGKENEYMMLYEGAPSNDSKRVYARCEVTSVSMDDETMENFNKKKAAVHDNRKM